MAARKTSVDPRQAALEALAPSFADPTPKILFGSKARPGFFTGSSAAVKAVANLCIAEGWLEDTGAQIGSGRNAKNLYRLTSNGRNAILENNPTKKLLETLDQSAKHQLGEIRGISLTLNAVSSRLERFEGAIQDVLEKVKNSSELVNGANTNSSLNGHAPREELDEEIFSRAHSHSINNPISLPELFKELNTRWTQLSLGEFHDSVRRLWKQSRIKLGPYTRSYGVIASDYEAIFLDGQVMYYAFAA